MTERREFKARKVETAVRLASETLGIPEAKLEYEIVSYGSTGIFGLVGVRKAVIRVETAAIEDPQEGAKEAAAVAETAPGAERPLDGGSAEDEDCVQFGAEVLRTIVETVSDNTRIAVGSREGAITYDVSGGNTGVLIGKRGQTLEAIQYLVEKIVNKRHERRVRIQVDVEGYLKKKRANLRNLATSLAAKAKKTGRPASIGQMNSHDRRIVHLALKTDSAVRTQSVGDGALRKLVIFPRRSTRERTGKTG